MSVPASAHQFACTGNTCAAGDRNYSKKMKVLAKARDKQKQLLTCQRAWEAIDVGNSERWMLQ